MVLKSANTVDLSNAGDYHSVLRVLKQINAEREQSGEPLTLVWWVGSAGGGGGDYGGGETGPEEGQMQWNPFMDSLKVPVAEEYGDAEGGQEYNPMAYRGADQAKAPAKQDEVCCGDSMRSFSGVVVCDSMRCSHEQLWRGC